MNARSAATAAGDTHTLPENGDFPEVARAGAVGPGPAVAFVLAAAAVAYLGFRGGGYDTGIREGFGLTLWWLVLLAAATGVAGQPRLSRATIVMASLFAALAAWTFLSLLWTDSLERTHTEGLRVLVLLGAFAGFSLLVARVGGRPVAAGVLAAVTGIGLLAVASRALPDLFPADSAAEFLPDVKNRLGYPIGYWNGLGALMALAVPLALHFGVAASRRLSRALSAAALPILGLTIFLTLSRGAVLAVIVAVTVLYALAKPRGPVLALAAVAVVLTAFLGWAAESRSEFADAVRSDALGSQGAEMLLLLALAMATCGLIGPALAARLGRRLPLGLPRPRRSVALTLVVIAVVFTAWKVVPSAVDGFLEGGSASSGDGAARLTTIGGNSRDQFWGAAIDAWQSKPLLGIGAGTWEFWWSQQGEEETAFARDAHSVFLESLGELGPAGLLLVGGLILFPVAAGFGAARTRAEGPQRGLIAAASAAAVAFLVSTGIDWTWEVTVVPVVFCALAAIVLPVAGIHTRTSRTAYRALLSAGAISAALLLASVASSIRIADSQSLAAAGSFEAAADAARDARDTEPFSASARLQEALALEAGGDLAPAASAAAEAVAEEPVNWRNWLVLGRIQARRNSHRAAVRAYRTAYSLNPRSSVVSSALEAEGISAAAAGQVPE